MMRRGERFREVGRVIGAFDLRVYVVEVNVCRYFGRARELPGVKEMFEAATQKPREDKPLESRADLRKQVDASYYGYNLDEEDGTLLAYEMQKEKEAFENLLAGKDGQAPKG